MKRRLLQQDGFVLVYLAVVTTALLLFTGLAVDTGRAYLVKAQLSKAVDGAALGAARDAQRRRSARRSRPHLQSEFSSRLSWHPRRGSDSERRVLQLGVRPRQRHEHRHSEGDGGAADDVHEAGELSRP